MKINLTIKYTCMYLRDIDQIDNERQKADKYAES